MRKWVSLALAAIFMTLMFAGCANPVAVTDTAADTEKPSVSSDATDPTGISLDNGESVPSPPTAETNASRKKVGSDASKESGTFEVLNSGKLSPTLTPSPSPTSIPTPIETNTIYEEGQNNTGAVVNGSPAAEVSTQTVGETVKTVNIQVGNKIFTIILYDNASTQVLLEQMPLTLNMSELNGNEKYYYLPGNLPMDSQRVGSIHTGDLMLYGSECLVLFYESFSTSYSYTPLGYMEDASGLVEALGLGSIQVTFSN